MAANYNKTTSLLGLNDQYNDIGTQVPYILMGAGSAGVNKMLMFYQHMAHAGQSPRVQSITVEDRNTKTKSMVLNQKLGVASIVPGFITRGTGYNRDPKAWEQDKPEIVEDQDVMVRAVREKANQFENDPQMMVMFAGLAAHTGIGLSIMGKWLDQFPRTIPMIVLSLPASDLVRQDSCDLIREYEPLFSRVKERAGVVLVVDDSMGEGDFRERDYRLGIGLASLDAACVAEGSSLVDCIGELKRGNKGNLFYGISVSAQPQRVTTTRSWSWKPPFSYIGAANGASKVLLRAITSEAVGIWGPDSRMAIHGNVYQEDFKKIAVAIPVESDIVQRLTPKLTQYFKASGDKSGTNRCTISFGPANFPEYRGDELYSNRNVQTKKVKRRISSFWTSMAKRVHGPGEPSYIYATAIYPIPGGASGYAAIPSFRALEEGRSSQPKVSLNNPPSRNGSDQNKDLPISALWTRSNPEGSA